MKCSLGQQLETFDRLKSHLCAQVCLPLCVAGSYGSPAQLLPVQDDS